MEATVLGYIYDQPRALKEAFDRREEYLKPFEELMVKKSFKKILFFGSGTSYNVSKIGEYYFKQLANINAEGHYPTVFGNYEKADWTGELDQSEILYFGISQSGTSISTLNIIKQAKKEGYTTCVLTEDLDSEITRIADHSIHLLCGKELTPPETRGYTVSVLQMFLFALRAAKILNTIDEKTYNEYIKETEKFISNYQIALDEAEQWYENNKCSIVNSDRIYVLGYGVDYPSALEGMLKIGEMLRLPTIAYEIEEFVHGPTMALTQKQTILMFGSDEPEWERCLHFRDVFLKYTDRVHLITDKEVKNDYRDMIFSVKTNKYLAPIMYTLPIQFVAAKGAKDTFIDTNINPFKDELGHLS